MENKENYISDELLAAYLEGNTNEEETLLVLQAMKKDKALQETLSIAISIDEEQEKSQDFLPMLQMAAESGENICSVLCEADIMKRRGFQVDVKCLLETAHSHGWLKAGGTPLHCVGKLLEEERLMVVRKYNATCKDIQEALLLHNDVIVVVDSDKLYPNQIDNEDLPNHAILVLSLNHESNDVELYDPQKLQPITHAIMADFTRAWKESHNYMVRILNSPFEYQPQPIPLDDISLTDDFFELREAIAENAHNVWAKARMAEGWTYGPERDDEKKQHPDLIPYSALPDNEKDYDRLMAMNTIKLVKKLGFKITKEE